ncbi:MAG: sodium:solute symporter family protein [Pseudomonadota bacterium]|nr:sodium:solute symporter family protein [Pseudomonadota bacterium]
MADGTLAFLLLFAVGYVLLLAFAHRGHGSRGGGLEEFFVSGRDLGLGTAIATLGATEIGLITIAYNAQKGFNEGFSAFHIGLAALIGCLFVGLVGFVVTPIRRTGVLTLPEYYEQRYGRDIRVFGALVMAAGGILNMGLFLKVASQFIAALLLPKGIDLNVTAVMVGLLATAVAYTCYGGMRSVVVTDVFQFVLLALGLIAACIFLLKIIPLSQVLDVVSDVKGADGFSPVTNPSFGLTYMAWMVLVAGVVSSAIWPTALTRALCIEKEETVRRAYGIASVVFMARMVVPAFLGVMAICYFAATGPGPKDLLSGQGGDADLLATPLMLGHAAPGWLLAFLIVAMFASFMSTQDSYLFCWASILSRDVVGVLRGTENHEQAQKLGTRVLIVIIALYELYWGLAYEGSEDVWDYLAVSGSIYFCSGIVLLGAGLYWKRATRRGALWALILGFSAVLGLGPVKAAFGLEALSGPEIGFLAIAFSLSGMVAGSLSETPKG